MTDRKLLDRPAVAARLNITVQKFMRSRDALAAAGFPRPVFGSRAGERWDPVAIDRWLDLRMPAAPCGSERGAAGGDYDALLDERAEQLGARH